MRGKAYVYKILHNTLENVWLQRLPDRTEKKLAQDDLLYIYFPHVLKFDP